MTEAQKSGQTPAIEFIDAAAGIAETVSDLETYSELMGQVTLNYAEAGFLDAALASAQRIEDPYSRDQVYGNLAASAVGLGDTEFADELVGKITDDSLYALALERLALAHARNGEFDQALEVVGELADGAAALSSIAVLYAENGDFDNALDVANAVEYPDLKVATFTQMVQRAIGMERNSEASEFLALALENADGIEILKEKTDALIGIGNFYAELGDSETAFEILLQAGRLCDSVQELMPDGFASIEALDQTLSYLVQGFASLHHYEEADSVLEVMESPFQFAAALTSVANERKTAGQLGDAAALLTQAVLTLDEEEATDDRSQVMKDSALARVAIAFAGIGELDKALTINSRIQSEDQRQVALQEEAILAVDAGEVSWAFTAGQQLESPLSRSRYYLTLADALKSRQLDEDAGETLAKIRTLSPAIDNPYEHARVLAQVGMRYAGTDDAMAREVFLQCLELVGEINDSFSKGRILILLAKLYGKASAPVGEKERSILEEMLPLE